MPNTQKPKLSMLNEAVHSMWTSAKRYRSIWLGPVSVKFRFARSARVSSNSFRRLTGGLKWSLSTVSAHTASDTPIPAHQVLPPIRDVLPQQETALVIGVGPGLGFALARKLAGSGLHVALASRNAGRLNPLVKSLGVMQNQIIRAYGCDASDEASVKNLMSHVGKDMNVPDLVVYSVQGFIPGSMINTEVAAFEECWRQNCLGAFIAAREAARGMLPLRRGTIVLIGSTSGMIGRPGCLNLAVGKFGLRALAQVMARELWPSGIHVAHLVVDADIREEGSIHVHDRQAKPEDISELVYMLYRQPKSSWTSEVDARPWNVDFWQHC